MKSILYILSAIIFCCSTVYAGNFEQVCLDIGYDEDSEKFHACVDKLSKRNKPLNKDVELAGKADYSPLIGAIVIGSATALAVDAMSGSSNTTGSSSGTSSSSEPNVCQQGELVGDTNFNFACLEALGIFK